ncbi:thrombospondin type 3 repeat-containing protein, partial [Streptomyces sp. NPDC057131]|uniref:thrombospondin type 3 repeat-containing protein n=1 Tax=Streptomyces sp. NPDC057131 TaxID=3346027 RepID=UPI00363A3746
VKIKEEIMYQKLKQKIEKIIIKGYEVVNVFDMNDTKGVPLPSNDLVPGNVKEKEFSDKTFKHLIKELQEELPIVLDENYSNDDTGYYSPLEHKIVVNANSNRSFADQYRTLIHEYARSIFFNETGKYWSYDNASKELQADSVAYVVTKSFGMDTSDYNFAYVQDWAAHKDKKFLIHSQENIRNESVNLIKKIEEIIMDKNITFDIPSVLDTNTSSISEGEQLLSLIQYGETFVIIKGDYTDKTFHSLESISQLGNTFKNKLAAKTTFELMKGHIPLQSALNIGNEQGKISVFQRNLIDPNDKLKKAWYFVGVPSLTNIKALTAPTVDKELAITILRRMTKKNLTVGENHQMEKDLASRDLDKDGLTDLQEMRNGTDPVNPDTND